MGKNDEWGQSKGSKREIGLSKEWWKRNPLCWTSMKMKLFTWGNHCKTFTLWSMVSVPFPPDLYVFLKISFVFNVTEVITIICKIRHWIGRTVRCFSSNAQVRAQIPLNFHFTSCRFCCEKIWTHWIPALSAENKTSCQFSCEQIWTYLIPPLEICFDLTSQILGPPCFLLQDLWISQPSLKNFSGRRIKM